MEVGVEVEVGVGEVEEEVEEIGISVVSSQMIRSRRRTRWGQGDDE